MILLALLLAQPTPIDVGLGELEKKNYREAAASFFAHLTQDKERKQDYERAEFLLATSLGKLGLNVAAGEYFYNVAHDRTNPELLSDALRAIRDLMGGPHDESLFERNLLAESELGRFPLDLDSFVSFTKGLEDLRDHHIDWAERHFARIDDDTPLRAESSYALGVQRLRRGDVPEAVHLLKAALVHPDADRKLRNEARLALARILYDGGQFEGALDLYGKIEVEPLAIVEPTVHLEKAWTHYRLGDLKAAMGSLHALDAPAYRTFHAPETFLLRALIFKDLCQYIPAKRAIRTFHLRFGETLENIHARTELAQDPILRAAALERGRLQRTAAFRQAIDEEAQHVAELAGDGELGAHLTELYRLKAKQIDRQMNALLDEQSKEVAEELIDFEEQMQLLDYELGLAIYQRVRLPAEGRENAHPEVPASEARNSHFRFDDEYWNDELDEYRFVLLDRCVRRRPGE